jgi:hypothetical protein
METPTITARLPGEQHSNPDKIQAGFHLKIPAA